MTTCRTSLQIALARPIASKVLIPILLHLSFLYFIFFSFSLFSVYNFCTKFETAMIVLKNTGNSLWCNLLEKEIKKPLAFWLCSSNKMPIFGIHWNILCKEWKIKLILAATFQLTFGRTVVLWYLNPHTYIRISKRNINI